MQRAERNKEKEERRKQRKEEKLKSPGVEGDPDLAPNGIIEAPELPAV